MTTPVDPDVPTLGDIAAILEGMRDQGVTYQSLEYAMRQVWAEDIERERRIVERTKALVAQWKAEREADAPQVDEPPC